MKKNRSLSLRGGGGGPGRESGSEQMSEDGISLSAPDNIFEECEEAEKRKNEERGQEDKKGGVFISRA
jgi:hypothetical protein